MQPLPHTAMENGTDSLVALYAVRGGVGVSCFLSIVGACAIVISYAAFPELRTLARQLLLNLSIADILLSFVYIWGLLQNADTVEDPYTSSNSSIPYWLCETQAFFIVFASDAATLWTFSIGVYFFVTIALQRPRLARRLLTAFYVFSWGVSFCVVLWLVLTDSLGYEPGSDPAFCGILSTVLVDGQRVDADYPILVGYEVWSYLAFVFLPVLFTATMCCNKRIERIEKKYAEREMSSLVSAELDSSISSVASSSSSRSSQSKSRTKLSEMNDKRMVIVPIVYMLLKFWGIAADIGIYFVPTHARTTYRQNSLSSVLVFISGVGRTLPGFVHGLLFCLLTKEVRQTMMKGLWSGITNCEICIYDYSCGVSLCRKRRNSRGNFLSDQSPCTEEITDPASTAQSEALVDTLSDYDNIVSSPDPTGSVSVVEIPQVATYHMHTELEEDDSSDEYS